MRAGVALLLLLLCAGCDGPGLAPSPALPPPVQVGEDTYMVPIADGDPTCPAWRMTSSTRLVVQALFYRKRDGSFTMNRAEACP